MEIGSEFWDIPITMQENSIFPDNCHWYSSGRAAEIAIIRAIKEKYQIKKVALPDWHCNSMVEPFIQEGVAVTFYPWQEPDFGPGVDVLFLMDHFGYRRSTYTSGFKGIIVRDLTQSVFCGEYSDADYYFGSLRKWAGFITGGYAWGSGLKIAEVQPEEYCMLRKRAMEQKKQYIFGERSDKGYLELFASAEKILDRYQLQAGIPEDVWNARHIDTEIIRKIRRRNANMLIEAFHDQVVFNRIEENDCPLFVPVVVEDRDTLQRKLIEREIYCPVHWTRDVLEGRELSLICDQRYTAEDMTRIIRVVKDYYAECNSN